MRNKRVAIIGGGAAGLACACFLHTKKYDVCIYEKNKAPGRKLLVAGKGGFNLTHSESIDQLITRYDPPGFLDNALRQFSNVHFRAWLKSIGIETFVGSSKRIFPLQGIKPIQVLKKIEAFYLAKNVEVKTSYEWQGENLGDIMIFLNCQMARLYSYW